VGNSGTLIISQSTLTGNKAISGGGVATRGTVTLSESTLTGNSVTNYGGGVFNYNSGEMTLSQCTLTGNWAGQKGGGIYNNDATLTLHHSLFSGNTATATPAGRELHHVVGTVNRNDFNLFGLSNNAGLSGITKGATDIVPASGVGTAAIFNSTLAFNGGPTQTLDLVSGSPALNRIPAANCTSSTDQRNFLRPSSGSTSCDVGAVEFGAIAATTVNSSVSFVAQTATYKTTTSAPSQCPAGTVGAFSFQALLTVKAGQSPLEALKAEIATLSQGNTLLLADGGAAGAPGQYTLLQVADLRDEQLEAGETLLVPFVICLQNFNKFQFFVNVLGHPLP
jgi:parallel beta-helix repeat protein